VVAADKLKPGDLVRVRPGERIPADGAVASGEAGADTAALTGESLPRRLEPGAEVLAGFVVLDAAVEVSVARPAAESSAARIACLVENARSNKARTERFITRFARWYTPAVVGLASATALVLWLAAGFPAKEAVHRALVMLVISCPCALVVSVPLAYFGGIGGAARRGILVKGAAVFDALARVRAAVFDKTGTLTHGVYEVKSYHPVSGGDHGELLRNAALAETHSNHPAARAILDASQGSHHGEELSEYREIAGYGVSVRHRGVHLLAGGHRLLHRENIPHDCVEDADTRVHVARGGVHLGSIAVGDRLKADSAAAVAGLRRAGVSNIVMLTGDVAGEAERIGQAAGLDSWRASCLPEDKLAELEKIITATKSDSRGGTVLFAGDGINDAPVIARADVGVAMGLGGQDAAIEAADLVIMNDSPLKVVEAITISRKTRRIVVENIAFALGIKLLFLAAGGFGLAGMWEAVIADVGVALLAVLNSIRAMRYRE
jgi:Cd2+/Zn2+-exporting ATPase